MENVIRDFSRGAGSVSRRSISRRAPGKEEESRAHVGEPLRGEGGHRSVQERKAEKGAPAFSTSDERRARNSESDEKACPHVPRRRCRVERPHEEDRGRREAVKGRAASFRPNRQTSTRSTPSCLALRISAAS